MTPGSIPEELLRTAAAAAAPRLTPGAQPVPLVVEAQQHLRHRQADQLGIGHLRRLARPASAQAAGRDDAVGQLHVKCGQESAASFAVAGSRPYWYR
jgi:hypothetical protein